MTQPSSVDLVYKLDHSIEVEPSPRWVRVQFGGQYVADSKRVLLIRSASKLPEYAFHPDDVRLELLGPAGEPTDDPRNGPTTYYTVKVNGAVAEHAAWTFDDPPPERAVLKGHVGFKWNKMDHWYEEEEEVFVHPRDPYKRVDTMPSSRHVRVVVDGVTVAETNRPTLLFETGLPVRYYLPPEDVDMGYLTLTSAHTRCPYKGLASYWSVRVGDEEYRNLVWGYPDPIPECPKIKGLLCFYNEKVDLYVDGEMQARPQSPWS